MRQQILILVLLALGLTPVFGTVAEAAGRPGYEGFLNDRVVSMASLLKAAGYPTYMAGKWHLGDDPDQDPSRRGFERVYTMLEGGASHFDDERMMYANYTRMKQLGIVPDETVAGPWLKMDSYPQTDAAWMEHNSDNRFSNWGKRGSRIAQGPGWAQASSTPFHLFKNLLAEGGIRSPLIISGPGISSLGERLCIA